MRQCAPNIQMKWFELHWYVLRWYFLSVTDHRLCLAGAKEPFWSLTRRPPGNVYEIFAGGCHTTVVPLRLGALKSATARRQWEKGFVWKVMNPRIGDGFWPDREWARTSKNIVGSLKLVISNIFQLFNPDLSGSIPNNSYQRLFKSRKGSCFSSPSPKIYPQN